MNLKKGLLFYGPPGTGKTHTIHYLTRAMAGHTTFLITAEQVGLLGEYMTLARLLQPSIVILEDADLIAQDRANLDVCEEVLLNKLLNEMDGLRPDSEIVFVLSTNRPEALEAALTARPGRIDQAIEFPLPDAEGRRKLAWLYAGNQHLDDDVVDNVIKRTEGTSAAFIKELMRRATQYAIMRDESSGITCADIEQVVEEMLVSGGTLNRKILGALEPVQAGSPAEARSSQSLED
jgi:ATP-dependent 26S proteasome regulatory subunit